MILATLLGTLHKHLLGGGLMQKGGALKIFGPCKGGLEKITSNFTVKKFSQ